MRTNKLLVFAAIALLIINAVLVYLLWTEKNKHKGGDRPKREDWFAEQLKLNDTQKEEHKKLRDAHFASMRPLFDSVSSYRTSLFKLSKDSTANDSLVNYYTNKLSETHSLIAKKTYEHFKKVRTLLTPEQQVKYDEVIEKMMNRRGGPPGKPGDKRKDD
jgi:Spy/CpxP family protein refolding chaperone